MTRIGFTGTQIGMTTPQRVSIARVLTEEGGDEFHVGDCIGADSDFVTIVRGTLPHAKIIGHPPIINDKRAFRVYDRSLPPEKYLERNHAIVNVCDLLIATPHSYEEIQRSGTWATIRYARKCQKRLIIVFPDGTIEQ